MTKEELEKENARLKEINTHTLSQLNLDNGELIIENEKLKKENAELKEALKNDKVCKCSHYLNFKDLEKQLTKAKEIIRDLLFHLGNTFIVSYTSKEESIIKAENFLKE